MKQEKIVLQSKLEPSIKQMLNIAIDMGIDDLSMAYDNYMQHYDCFFLIDDYDNQYKKFVSDLKSFGLVEDNILIDITATKALEMVNRSDLPEN